MQNFCILPVQCIYVIRIILILTDNRRFVKSFNRLVMVMSKVYIFCLDYNF